MRFDNWLNRIFKSATRRSRGKLDHPAPMECCEQRILLSGTGVFIDGGDAFDDEISGVDSLGDEISGVDQVALGDLDGNGTIDAFTVDWFARSRVWLNDGSGTFVDTGQRLGDPDTAARDVKLADLDGDGDLDAFVALSTRISNRVPLGNLIWLNDGAGNFTDSGQRLGNSSSHEIALADLDGDGDIDAFVGNLPSSLGYDHDRVWLNNGSGIFVLSGQTLPGRERPGSSYDVALADIDSDGDVDAFVAVWGDSDRLLLNDGTGTFVDSGQGLSDLPSTAVALGDVDGDGDVDAVVGSNADTGFSQVWLNDGSGSLFPTAQVLDAGNTVDLILTDLDNDRDLDLLVGDRGHAGIAIHRIWLNYGNGVFAENTTTLGMGITRDLGVADLDGDLDVDVVVMHGNKPARVWFNVNAPVPVDVNLPATSGTFELVRDGSDVVVRTQGGAEIFRDAAASVPALLIHGSNVDDTLIVDLTNGDPIPAGGLTFDGMGNLGTDKLEIIGGSASQIDRYMLDYDEGRLKFDSDVIAWSNVEQIIDRLTAADRAFYFANSDELLTLSDGDVSLDGIMRLTRNGVDPPIDFANPTNSLTIHAGGGDDTVSLNSADQLFSGTITVNGDGGDDRVMTSFDKSVRINGGTGNDVIHGGMRADVLSGGAGNDVLNGRGGNDSLAGGSNDDRLLGGSGDDVLDGGEGNDRLRGHSGHDTLTGGQGNDHLDGSAGRDRLIESGDADFTLTDTQLTGLGTDQLVRIENVELIGGDGNNILDASIFSGDVTLRGGNGHDTIFGGSGNDLIEGGFHHDSLHGGGGDDQLFGDYSSATANYSGNDTLYGDDGDDSLFGGGGRDALSGMDGNDLLNGNSKRDTLLGGSGNDTLLGGGSFDILLGGSGADSIKGQTGVDVVAGGGNGKAADPDDTVLGENIDDDLTFDAPWVNA